jgi:hypothetical protein
MTSTLIRQQSAVHQRKGGKTLAAGTTQGLRREGEVFRGRFINNEGLKRELQGRDFLDLLAKNEVLGIAASWAELEKCEIRRYQYLNKGRCKTTRYGRNPEELVVYFKNIIQSYFEAIVAYLEENMDRYKR